MENIIVKPQVTGADETDVIQITPSAFDALKNAFTLNNVPDTYFIRMKSQSGGCSGMNFSMEFDFDFKPDVDKELVAEGIRLVSDKKTMFYLMGITLDFIDDEDEKGFVFRGFRNFKTCGCH